MYIPRCNCAYKDMIRVNMNAGVDVTDGYVAIGQIDWRAQMYVHHSAG